MQRHVSTRNATLLHDKLQENVARFTSPLTFIQNPCARSACKPAQGICQVGFNEEGYRCVCETGYTGNGTSCDGKVL